MGQHFKLTNGLLLLSTEAPGGVYNSTQLKKIATLCDDGAAMVKATEDQRLALLVAPDKVAQVTAALKTVGLGARHYQDGIHQPVNCLGELCPEHQQDAMGAGMALARELASLTSGTALKIGVNGCARSCVATHTLDISVIGEASGYRISLGGKNSQLPEMASFMAEGVPAAKLPKLIAKVVTAYRSLAQKGETLQEAMERAGSKAFIDALAPYSQDAAGADDPFAGDMMEGAAPEADLAVGDLGGESFDKDLDLGADAELMQDAGPAVHDDLGMDEIGSAPDVGMTDDLATDDLPLDDGAAPGTEELSLDDVDAVGDANASAAEVDVESLDNLEMVADDLEDLTTSTPLAGAADSTQDDEAELGLDDVLEPASKARLAAVPPAAEASADDELVDEDLDAAEVAEDEADAFEAKLEESIAEEEAVPVIEDTNAKDRLAAVQLVEAGVESDPLVVDGGFENLEIDRDVEVLDVPDAEFEPETFSADEVDAASAPAAVAAPLAAQGARSGAFEFTGFDVGANGDVTLSFSSGATVVLDARTVSGGSRRFVVGGKTVSVQGGARGARIEVDGIAIILPSRAA
jgi:hypothetical protein